MAKNLSLAEFRSLPFSILILACENEFKANPAAEKREGCLPKTVATHFDWTVCIRLYLTTSYVLEH
ncbi:hypothetical protein PROAA_2210022 [Candidatus Propionivibrio aalborgensis]|uniref:Uncharacterized protein n=1 Tax=Candidatus Propionivibrio aalborgensis TaxID=1860101 RepID=A0A1A8XQX1_9RHOO|nr:hypothetical protein PROAA_2210022 [Candidatus Propionivibrio aalborgensis]